MEPYSADKIKRKKRKYFDPKEEIIINVPFSNIVKSNDIYKGDEKIPFKKRVPEYQAILRNEFE
ncbi:MAG: hypothetical protein ACFFBI_14240 [Promethearchaeota archaeon]